MFKINSKINLRRAISGLIIILSLILLVLAISAKVASQNKPVETIPVDFQKPPNFTIEYNIIQSETQRAHYIIDLEGKKTVFDVLKKLAEIDKAFEIKYNYNYPKLGVLIESIGGIKGDNEKYWQFYINGALGQLAADKQELKAGDKVEWRFEKTPAF